MKKLFLVILFSAVLFFGLPNFKISAMPITYDIPFSAVPDFVNILNTILSGGEINIKGISSLEELQAEWNNSQLSTKNFLQRTAQSLFNQMVDAAMSGQDSLTDTGADFIYKCLPEDLAYFMSYNIDWYRKANKPVDIVLPTPDHAYDNLLNKISTNYWNTNFIDDTTFNNSSFVFINLQNSSPYDALSLSNGFDSNSNYCAAFNAGDISIYINQNNDTYSFTFTPLNNSFQKAIISNGQTQYTFPMNFTSGHMQFTGFGSYSKVNFTNYLSTGIFPNTFIDLESCLTAVSNYFSNVNIYVNGVLWALAGNVPEDFISAPDVISLGDLGLEIYDVFFPGDIDGYQGLSINGFIEWLKQQLGVKDHISLGDLIDEDVPIIITNDGTTGITYDDTRPVPKVIEDEIDIPDDPDPNPSVTPTNTPFPLPPFPKFPIPSDIPNANIQHTVLAEIVDATQSVVPDDLMVLIWSTFGLLAVGGLIYILHK